VGGCGGQGVLSGHGDVRGQPFAQQPTPDQRGHPYLVLDYQHPHAAILRLQS
jgi:hypothetical protein